ncbi:MAG: hypothetical protein RL333_506 [Pseudomonadota bacterium]
MSETKASKLAQGSGKLTCFVKRAGITALGLFSILAHGLEAPTGYDGQTNGYLAQSTYDQGLAEFNKAETPADGLGPVFNDVSCQACHKGPVDGGASQVKVQRAGYFDGANFIDPPGGSLIPAKAIDPSIQAHIPRDANVRTFRTSLSTLGDGYVEAIPDSGIIQIASDQPKLSGGLIHGQYILVDLLESPGHTAVGKFGWKAQHASLVSFSADAYRNEMGITTPLFPSEPTSNGRSVDSLDRAGRPNDTTEAVVLVANFMRSTKAPARTPGSLDSGNKNGQKAPSSRQRALNQGEQAFLNAGCGICHVATFVTLPAGTRINGGAYEVPAALGSATIHPYSDFLLHDIGTGDGIVQNGGQSTRNKIRTMPLWGLSKRRTFLHDGSANSISEAINRHSGEASGAVSAFQRLPPQANQSVMSFLNSL